MRNFSIKNTKWLNKGHELDYIASLIMRPQNEMYLVGSEKEVRGFYKRVGHVLVKKGLIKGVVLTESNDSIEGIDIPIVSDTDIPKSVNTVVICTAFDRGKYESVKQLFEGYGYYENRQFFQGEVFTLVYEVYVLNKICIDRVEIFATSCCPLKCEKCIAYIPYFKKYEHTPLEQLKKDADLLFSKVDYVFKYKIVGGDGLAYPFINEYVDYLCKSYGHKIGSVRIGTNGTIIPEKDLLDVCKKYGVTLDVSDYRVTIGDRSKLEEIVSLCDENGVSVDVKRTGEQWLDMGFPKKLPGERGEFETCDHFAMCAMFCRDFDDGKLYYCCSNFAAVKAGLFPADENDYFDFNEEFSKKELMEYELGFSDRGHTTFCQVCRGCSDEVNPFHTEVARQVKGR